MKPEDKKDAEIAALRTANMGLRAKVFEIQAHALAQYAKYDQNLADLRGELASYYAKEAVSLNPKVAASPAPG